MRRFVRACLWVVLCVTVVGCDRKSREGDGQSFAVHGTLANATPGPVVLTFMQGEFAVHDSSTVAADGHFEIRGNATRPVVARLSLSKENFILLVIDTSDITVSADAGDLAGTARVSGSEESSLMQSLSRTLAENRKTQDALERQFALAHMQEKTDSVIYYQEQFLRLQTETAGLIKKFIREHPRSFSATYAAAMLLDNETEGTFLDSIVAVFNKTIPQSSYVKELNDWAKDRVNVSVGSLAPELVLPRPDGSALALSALKGKYVLIDFWASWCGPCRKENPAVVALYNRYKDKGFEIYGVSLDDSKEMWLAAVSKDGLPWPQVCDLKGGASPAAETYNVTTIPSTFLLDRDGKIIARDLRGETLATTLARLLGK